MQVRQPLTPLIDPEPGACAGFNDSNPGMNPVEIGVEQGQVVFEVRNQVDLVDDDEVSGANMTWILEGFSSPSVTECTMALACEGPDYFLGRLYYDTALSASPHCFSSLLTVTDSAHILFGTDFVFATDAAVPATIAGIQGYEGFTGDDHVAIACDNAYRSLPGFR